MIPRTYAVVLAFILVVVSAVTPFLHVNAVAHTAILTATTLLAAVGIGPELASAFGKLIPVWAAHILGLGVTFAQALQQNILSVPTAWHAVIAAVLTTLAALGIVAYTPVVGNAPPGSAVKAHR